VGVAGIGVGGQRVGSAAGDCEWRGHHRRRPAIPGHPANPGHSHLDFLVGTK